MWHTQGSRCWYYYLLSLTHRLVTPSRDPPVVGDCGKSRITEVWPSLKVRGNIVVSAPWYKTQIVVPPRWLVEAPWYRTWAIGTSKLWVETPWYKTMGCTHIRLQKVYFFSLVAALGAATGATIFYFSSQIASIAEKKNSVCCGIPVAQPKNFHGS